MKNRFFWKDGYEGPVQGGYYFRAFDLVQFIKLVEKEENEVVGIEFDGNNVNVLVKGDGEAE
tara:strand:- start:69 stop:254 length:186 start_codon:yes stop_codon:yes gene_type:complete